MVENVKKLLAGEAHIGDHADMRIDIALRELWGISADHGLYINLELAQLPAGQVITELFPGGVPKVILKTMDTDGEQAEADIGSDVEVAGVT